MNEINAMILFTIILGIVVNIPTPKKQLIVRNVLVKTKKQPGFVSFDLSK